MEDEFITLQKRVKLLEDERLKMAEIIMGKISAENISDGDLPIVAEKIKVERDEARTRVRELKSHVRMLRELVFANCPYHFGEGQEDYPDVTHMHFGKHGWEDVPCELNDIEREALSMTEEGSGKFRDLLEHVADLAWRMSYCEAREEMGLPVGGAVPGPKDAPKMDLSKQHDHVSMYSHIIDKALDVQ